jgi:hypothetical protein
MSSIIPEGVRILVLRSLSTRWALLAGAVAGLVLASAAWAQAPQLVSVDPPNGATDVATDAEIVFVFDQPMDTSVPLVPSLPQFGLVGNYELTGAGQFNFLNGTWSEDGLTLTCTATVPFPANSTVVWTLNPVGSTEPFTNEDGTELATVTGSFTVGTGGGGGGDEDCNGLPDGWGGYSFFKGARYEQTSTADPVPEMPEPFAIGVSISSPEAGPEVTEASLTLPDTSEVPLDGFFGTFFFFEEFDEESALDTAYPAGAYTLRFTQSGEPERVVPMSMPANNVPVPKIQNYDAAQQINAAEDFTLQWNSFTGADPGEDFLVLTIFDSELAEVVFQAPDFCLPRELAVTATSVVIPSGTLVDGRTYSGSLSFGRGFHISTNDIPDMAGSGNISRDTSFDLHAGTGGGGPADPATLSGFQLLGNGNPEFQLAGSAGTTYTIERTSDLTPTIIWELVGTVTMDGAGQGSFEDTEAAKVFPLFYRAVAD